MFKYTRTCIRDAFRAFGLRPARYVHSRESGDGLDALMAVAGVDFPDRPMFPSRIAERVGCTQIEVIAFQAGWNGRPFANDAPDAAHAYALARDLADELCGPLPVEVK